MSPDDYRTYYQRAVAHQEVSQFQKAMNEFSEAIKRSANATNVLAQLYYQRGQNYLRLGENDKAEADFRRVPEYAPGDVMGYNNLAWFYVTGPATFRSPEKALPLALKAVELGQTNHTEYASFDFETAPDFFTGYFLGDYFGLATAGNDFLAVFGQTHGADPASIFFRRAGP